MDYLWTPWRYQYLTSAHKPAGCIFCTMAAAGAAVSRVTSEHPAPSGTGNAAATDEEALIVFRGIHNFVVLNRFPYTNGHLMIVPYQHAADLAGITEPAAIELMALTREAERHLKWIYRPDGINIGMNIGAAAGAGVTGHIHMHVLPRWTGDSSFMTTTAETRMLGETLPFTWQRMREAFARPQSH